MKKILSILLFLVSFSTIAQEYKEMIEAGTYTVDQIQKKAEAYFEGKDKGRGSGYKQYKRWEYFALRQRDADGFIKDPNYLFDEWNQYSKIQNQRNSNKVMSFNDDWSELGPTYWNATSGWNPGVGRLSSMAVDLQNQDHIIVGSIGGGIWKTSDAGSNWQPLSDNHGNMYVYSLAMDPNNTSTYYWGSSEGRIYKSTDGGSVWTQIGNTDSSSVLKILVHPTNSNIVFASVQYHGLYKSIDGGNSWSRVIFGQMYDVEFDPNDNQIVFASGAGSNGFYRSTDGGDSFTQISGFGGGVKMLGVTKADSYRVYVLEANNNVFGGFYKSVDHGLSFQEIDHGNKNYLGYDSNGFDSLGQAPRDMGITVSPTDPNEVHIAGINSWISLDAGDSFSITSQWQPGMSEFMNIGYCHADVDDIEFFGDNLYVVTDGGLFIAEDSNTVTSSFYKDLTTGMGIRQFYLMGVSQTDPVIISSGSQDNGTSILQQDGNWYDWLGADGFESIVDVNNPDVIYGSIYYGTMFKSTDQGNSYFQISRPESTGWITPIEQASSGNLYFGGNKVYKSSNGGSGWDEISTGLSGLTNQVKISPVDEQYIYASSNNGRFLYKTETGGGMNVTWERKSGYRGFINSIALHPTDKNKIAIAVTGSSEKVYISEDGGDSWKGYSDNLPDFTPYALVWDDNGRDGLYLGMDYGVYYIDNQYSEWNLFNNKLPNVRVTELEINYADNYLYVCTYGRGIWRSPRSNGVLDTESHILESLSVYPNPVENELNISWNQTENVSVRLFNYTGQLLYYRKSTNLSEPLQINTSQLASGLYFLKINTNNGSTTRKVVIN